MRVIMSGYKHPYSNSRRGEIDNDTLLTLGTTILAAASTIAGGKGKGEEPKVQSKSAVSASVGKSELKIPS